MDDVDDVDDVVVLGYSVTVTITTLSLEDEVEYTEGRVELEILPTLVFVDVKKVNELEYMEDVGTSKEVENEVPVAEGVLEDTKVVNDVDGLTVKGIEAEDVVKTVDVVDGLTEEKMADELEEEVVGTKVEVKVDVRE